MYAAGRASPYRAPCQRASWSKPWPERVPLPAPMPRSWTPCSVLAQGLGVLGVAGPGLVSSEGDAEEWQLMNESLGLRGPFVIHLRGRIPHPAGYPECPRTLGDHLKKARLNRGLPQKDAARAIGCASLTFLHWEKGRIAPDVRFWPADPPLPGLRPPGRSLRPLLGRSGPHVRPRGYPIGILPPGEPMLDPFAGSGTTCVSRLSCVRCCIIS